MKQHLRDLLGPLAALAAVYAIFWLLAPQSFLTMGNQKTLLVQATVVAVGAVGMTYVIVSGGIDLSVGSVMALSAVVAALVTRAGGSDALAALAGMGTGLAVGLVNGTLVGVLRIAPFIATLGTMGAARGLAKGLAGERSVYPPDDWQSSFMAATPEPGWLLAAPGMWTAVILAVVAGLALRRTVAGTWVYAVGSSERTALLCGIPVKRTKVAVYAFSGACAGLGGVLLFHRLGTGDPTAALGRELDVVAAVVVGGAALSGGEGGMLGSMIGTLLMAALANGANLVDIPALEVRGIPTWVQEIGVGAIIVAAVWLDRRRAAARA